MIKRLGLAALALTLTAPVASADEDMVKAGEKVFKKCMACHAVGEKAKNKVGPHLNDLFGRVPGKAEDYKYSKAMIAYGEEGNEWNDETLDAYLEKPKDVVKGTKMVFPGLRKEDDRKAVIAYLKTFDSDAATQ